MVQITPSRTRVFFNERNTEKGLGAEFVAPAIWKQLFYFSQSILHNQNKYCKLENNGLKTKSDAY